MNIPDSFLRVKVIHAGRRTTISMDQHIYLHLQNKLGEQEDAIQWIRTHATQLPEINEPSPSLSRRMQMAILDFLLGALPSAVPGPVRQ